MMLHHAKVFSACVNMFTFTIHLYRQLINFPSCISIVSATLMISNIFKIHAVILNLFQDLHFHRYHMPQ